MLGKRKFTLTKTTTTRENTSNFDKMPVNGNIGSVSAELEVVPMLNRSVFMRRSL